MHEKKWFIFYTFPKSEKIIKSELIKQGYDVFLPLHKVIHHWSDRNKTLNLPIFPNYIFVKTSIDRLYSLLQSPRIVRYVSFNKVPATINDRKIELIKKICESGMRIHVSCLEKGCTIIIRSGPFKGYIGKLSIIDKKYKFGIELLEFDRIVWIDLNNIEFEKVS